MKNSRREFLAGGATAATVGIVAASLGGKQALGAEAGKKPAMIGACGLSCIACPVMKAKKCKGCASGKEASPEMIKKKGCKVLKCAAMKKLAYCGDCKMFTKCKKIIGKPYDQKFVDMQAKRMGA